MRFSIPALAFALIAGAASTAAGQGIMIEDSAGEPGVRGRTAFHVRGAVYYDTNVSGRFEPEVEEAAPGIAVSDGENVVLSDENGRYELQSTSDTRVIFITQPAGHERGNDFYRIVPAAPADDESTVPLQLTFDFAIRKRPQPDPAIPRFVQTTDIHINGPADLDRFKAAVDEINRLAPPADFVVATGDLVNTGERLEQLEAYSSGSATCRVPWFHVFGNHDANRGDYPARNYHRLLAPDYYSVGFGDLHLLMLNSIHRSPRQDRWIRRDLELLAKGKKVFAFQHYPAEPQDLANLQGHDVRAIFTGHWHSNKITSHGGGIASINQPTFLMGGIDGSPSSFRIVTVNGERITTQFRFNDFEKHLFITYPQGELTGQERLIAQIYDSVGGVREARFRIGTPETSGFAEGQLTQVSPLAWMASLEAKDLGVRELPPEYHLQVRATNHAGERWEAVQPMSRIRRVESAAAVKTRKDWPLFMGNAQRTGSTPDALKLPLALRWATPTHGAIDYGSPVLYKGRVAIGVKDRDNLINNGVAILDAKTGKSEHFIKTDAMINHSPAFAEDAKDGPGRLYAQAAGGTVYVIHPGTGAVLSETPLGEDNQRRWIYSSPAVQDKLAVLGSGALMMAVGAQSGESRWMSKITPDWISSYASPSLAGPSIIMGANWHNDNRKPASIFALNAQNGQVLWKNECKGIHASVAVVAGRGFAVDIDGKFKVIDLETGKDIYSKQLEKGWSMSTPAVDPQVVVVPTGDGTIHAFDFNTLEERWTFHAKGSMWKISPYSKEKNAVFSSPTIAGDTVFVGSSDGRLYALDKLSGAVRWYYDLGVPTLATPCVSGNALFTAAYDGTVYAFTSRD
jgi:outer membrane protein assembly factor BamB/predicted phosphodiesterase